MDLQEYRLQAKTIRDKAEAEVKQLAREFAFANSTVQIGDKITSRLGHGETIIVEEIKYSIKPFLSKDESPECVYRGVLLTKKGQPRKDGQRSNIFQSDMLIEK